MGFRIFANGHRGYRRRSGRVRRSFIYSRNNCLDRSDFDPPKLLAMIPGSPSLAGVLENQVGTAESNAAEAMQAGIYAQAKMIFAHQVVNQVNLLAMHGQHGNISLYCHEKNRFWADSNSYTYCYLWGVNPGREEIGPGLEKTDLNNFGVLHMLARVLGRYEMKLPRSAVASIRIEIWH